MGCPCVREHRYLGSNILAATAKTEQRAAISPCIVRPDAHGRRSKSPRPCDQHHSLSSGWGSAGLGAFVLRRYGRKRNRSRHRTSGTWRAVFRWSRACTAASTVVETCRAAAGQARPPAPTVAVAAAAAAPPQPTPPRQQPAPPRQLGRLCKRLPPGKFSPEPYAIRRRRPKFRRSDSPATAAAAPPAQAPRRRRPRGRRRRRLTVAAGAAPRAAAAARCAAEATTAAATGYAGAATATGAAAARSTAPVRAG